MVVLSKGVIPIFKSVESTNSIESWDRVRDQIKLLALDMDGTTLTSDKTISDQTAKWIKRATDAGVTVSFATGRGGSEVEDFAKDLGLQTPQIMLNGGLIKGADGTILETHFLEQDLIQPLYELACKYDTWFWGYTARGRILKKDWDESWLNVSWYKFGFSLDDENVLAKIREQLDALGDIEVTSSDWNNIEVNPKGVTKAAGVRTICQKLGLSMKNVMAIGDSLNDYPLFEEPDVFAVAMGNADPRLKEIAAEETCANDEDGVAYAIQRFLFEE